MKNLFEKLAGYSRYLGFQPELPIIRQALRNCGLDTNFTVQKAINSLISENNTFDSSLNNDDFWKKHDLAHIFADAVGGTGPEELPALQMQNILFRSEYAGLLVRLASPDESSDAAKDFEIEKRSAVIASSYRSLFLRDLSEASFSKLKNIPVAAFGLQAVYRNGHTHYDLIGDRKRIEFLNEFARLQIKAALVTSASAGTPEIPNTVQPA